MYFVKYSGVTIGVRETIILAIQLRLFRTGVTETSRLYWW